jgi:hydroxyacylglutathione hydrolase
MQLCESHKLEDDMHEIVTNINLGGVNCYLAECADGFVLIDTGFSGKRALLLQALQKAGCLPGNLKFVLITHGDPDHAGNAAFLQREYRASVGIHPDDVGMVEKGDMNWNRKPKADKVSLSMKVFGVMTRSVAKSSFETFKPDVTVTEEFDLFQYGLRAKIVHIPGHSKGSIGVLMDNGNLYCGDFLYTIPGMNHVDDMEARKESLSKLKKLPIKEVYPGHGKPTHLVR